MPSRRRRSSWREAGIWPVARPASEPPSTQLRRRRRQLCRRRRRQLCARRCRRRRRWARARRIRAGPSPRRERRRRSPSRGSRQRDGSTFLPLRRSSGRGLARGGGCRTRRRRRRRRRALPRRRVRRTRRARRRAPRVIDTCPREPSSDAPSATATTHPRCGRASPRTTPISADRARRRRRARTRRPGAWNAGRRLRRRCTGTP